MKLLALVVLILMLMYTPSEARKINTIIVHHTGVDVNQTVEEIRQYHVREKGWDDIGYHYIITKDGKLHKGREDTVQGAHAKGRNATSLGVCLVGDKIFSSAQMNTLKELLTQLQKIYNVESIQPHHDKCPGYLISSYLKRWGEGGYE